MNRAEAEAIYARGRDAVVEALLDLDRQLAHGGGERRSAPPAGRRGRVLELPARFESVVLIPPSGERVPAAVQEHAPDGLLLVVVVPIAPFTRDELAEMVLEYPIAEGRVRVGGSFSCPDPSAPELVRLESEGIVDVLQEREFFRVAAVRAAHLVLVGREREPLPTHTVNIGAGGALLDAPRTLAVGQPVRVEIALRLGEPPVRAQGRVVRVDDSGRPVIAFDAVDDIDRKRLARFVADRRLEEGFGPG